MLRGTESRRGSQDYPIGDPGPIETPIHNATDLNRLPAREVVCSPSVPGLESEHVF